jgi:UDP-N-acetylmuramoyl-L-alanyl-D-glutamate--2,6-diaminopimelate ligase
MKLKELLHDVVPNQDIPDIEITSVCSDSRRVIAGSLFFAIPGSTYDGSRFIAAALKGGAAAIIHQTKDELNASVPHIQVANVRNVLAHAASRFFTKPSEQLYLCGITGTNGKTTLTYILEKFWEEKISGIIGTINFRYATHVLKAPNTTPDAITIQELLSQMAKSNVSHVAMEVSSHGLEQNRVVANHFNACVFTNLTQDHLDYHSDMESYYQVKKLLFSDSLSHSSKKNKLAVIDNDDSYGQRLIEELKEYEYATLSYSLTKGDVAVNKVTYSLKGTEALLNYKGKEIKLTTNLMGAHNLKNVMAALLIGEHSGISLETMLEKLKNIHVPGRLELVKNTQCFIDYAHTPDALNNVLPAIKDVMTEAHNTGRLIVVFGCGGDRDKIKRPLMGEAVAKQADISVVTSDNPRTEDPDDIIGHILPGVQKRHDSYDGFRGYLVEPSRRKAIEQALDLASPEDVVLIAGKGHENYQIIGTQRFHFDDKEVVEEWLEKKLKSEN